MASAEGDVCRESLQFEIRRGPILQKNVLASKPLWRMTESA